MVSYRANGQQEGSALQAGPSDFLIQLQMISCEW